jgi:CheY-like chemotaxis protein
MPSERAVRPVEILLVEDNPGDVRLTQEALRDGKVWNNLSHVADGVEAVKFLYRQGEYVSAPTPDLFLLDLNLPRKDGREVLSEIKTDARFARIPVVVLTTSRAEEDVLRSYGLHANCYIVKPIDLDRFIEIVQSIESFWLCVVTLPSSAHSLAA